MNKRLLALFTSLVLLCSANALAGDALRSMGNLDPGVTQPNSRAFGKSLDGWMEAYIRWLEDGADPADRVKNVAFLPILGESPFTVEVEPGRALVLPIVAYLGFPEDEPLPDEWWGDPNFIAGEVYLDGQPIGVPNADYYVGPTYLDPPAILFGFEIAFYQAIVVVIQPLTPGEHHIVLSSKLLDQLFENEWMITVTPPGKN